MSTESTWKIEEQDDGSAVIYHDGAKIGTIWEKPGRRQNGVDYADVPYEIRDYIVTGRTVEVVGSESFVGHMTFSTSIGAAGSEREKVSADHGPGCDGPLNCTCEPVR